METQNSDVPLPSFNLADIALVEIAPDRQLLLRETLLQSESANISPDHHPYIHPQCVDGGSKPSLFTKRNIGLSSKLSHLASRVEGSPSTD